MTSMWIITVSLIVFAVFRLVRPLRKVGNGIPNENHEGNSGLSKDSCCGGVEVSKKGGCSCA